MTETGGPGAIEAEAPGTWDAVVRRLSDLFEEESVHVRCNLVALAAALHQDPKAIDAMAQMAATASERLAAGGGSDAARVLQTALVERETLPESARHQFDHLFIAWLSRSEQLPDDLAPLLEMFRAHPSEVIPRLGDLLRREPADRRRRLVTLVGEQVAGYPETLDLFADLSASLLLRYLGSKGDDDPRVLGAIRDEREQLSAPMRLHFDRTVAGKLGEFLRAIDEEQTMPALVRLLGTPTLLPASKVAQVAIATARALEDVETRDPRSRDELRTRLRRLAEGEAGAPHDWRRELRAALNAGLGHLEPSEREIALFRLMRGAPELVPALDEAASAVSRGDLRAAAGRGRRGSAWFWPVLLGAAGGATALVLLVALGSAYSYIETGGDPIGSALLSFAYLFVCGTMSGAAAMLSYAPTLGRDLPWPARVRQVLMPAILGALPPLVFVLGSSSLFDTRAPAIMFPALFVGQMLLLGVSLLIAATLAGASLRTRRLGSEYVLGPWVTVPALVPPTLLCLLAGAVGGEFVAQFWPIFCVTGVAVSAGAWRIEARSMPTFNVPRQARDLPMIRAMHAAGVLLLASCVAGAAASSFFFYRRPPTFSMPAARNEAPVEVAVLRPITLASGVALRIDAPAGDPRPPDRIATRTGKDAWSVADASFLIHPGEQICYGCSEQWPLLKNWLPLVLPVQRGDQVVLTAIAPVRLNRSKLRPIAVTLNGPITRTVRQGQLLDVIVSGRASYSVAIAGRGGRQGRADVLWVPDAEVMSGGDGDTTDPKTVALKPGRYTACVFFWANDGQRCPPGDNSPLYEEGIATLTFAPAEPAVEAVPGR